MSILDVKFSEILQAIYCNEVPGLTSYIDPTPYIPELSYLASMEVDSVGSVSDESYVQTPDTPRTIDSLGSLEESRHVAQKRKLRSKESKICRVCGDRALGYNFDAITCESCKAFFRRNALKSKPLACMFSKDCKIDINTRRFCSACRLQKCLDVGMKKDMILDDTERQKRTMKVKMNRERRQVLVAIKSETSESMGPACENASSSTLPQRNVPMTFPWNDPHDSDESHRQLTPEENSLIHQFEQLYMVTVGNTEEDIHPPDMTEEVNLNVLINSMGAVVRRLIRFAKKIDDFISLEQVDQINILKGMTLTCLFIRSAQLFSVEKDAWITPRGETPSTVLHDAVQDFNKTLHMEHLKFVKELRKLLRDDTFTIALLQITCLFTPIFASVGSKAYVSNLQDRYSALLKHYLEATYGYAEAFSIHTALMMKLSEIRVLSENHGKVLLSCDPDALEPLLLEIFDFHDIGKAKLQKCNTVGSI